MRTRILAASVLALALAVAVPALAADNAPVLGKWTTTVQTPQGSNEVVFEFTEEGGVLKGAWSNPRRSGDLDSVSWDGETLKFTRSIQTPQRTFELNYEATVDGDVMTGRFSTPRGEREFTAKRSG